MVVPVAAKFNGYAEEVRQRMHDAGLFADADLGENTFNKKIRNAEVAQYNFVLGMSSLVCTPVRALKSTLEVVGQAEVDQRAVNVRTRVDASLGVPNGKAAAVGSHAPPGKKEELMPLDE